MELQLFLIEYLCGKKNLKMKILDLDKSTRE